MSRIIVRISEIELKGFKNTKYGQIEMPSTSEKNYFIDSSDILGIYGQNGSGKTAIIEAMEIIQTLLSGRALSRETINYISREVRFCTLSVKFLIKTDNKISLAEYSVVIKNDDNELVISHEILSATIWNGEKFENKKTLIDYQISSEGTIFTPKYRFEDLVNNNDDNKINLGVAKKIAQKELLSFIFCNEGRAVFLSAPERTSEEYSYIIKALYDYARMNLFVISNIHAGVISMNLLIPFSFRLERDGKITKGDLPIRLDGPSVVNEDHYNIAKQIINEMNTILNAMIPGLSIDIYDFGEQLLENGSIGHKIELVSKRGQTTIPLKYESEGILKIVSILNTLMCVYNSPSMCLVIDELDAGIFEFLLGEILSVFEKGAKGQLIFTSHNLRALEMLNKRSIMFSTTNETNRYIHLQKVKNNNNLRDMYLRSIILGGQKENIYAETDSVEIGRAFRRAGKEVRNGCQN